MWDDVAKYWVSWACGIGAAALVATRKKMAGWWKRRKQRQAALEYADRWVLFGKLKDIYRESVEQGYVTVEDLQEAEETYQHYHNLGGNGKATIKIETLRAMEVRPE